MNGCFPPKPSEPLASDCCGTGCNPCVFNIYEKEVEIWQKECQEIEGGITIKGENQEEVISKDFYQEYSVINIEKETSDTFKFRFDLKQHKKLPLEIGQHLVMRWKCCTEGCISRQYTPVIRSNVDIGFFDIIIKIYTDGKMSEYVGQWKIGTQVEWRGPFGKFDYKPNHFNSVILLAAGTGIAPMTQIIHSILDNEDDETIIYLLYSVKHYENIICKNWLDKWKDYWNFKSVFFITQDSKASKKAKFGEKVINDRITKNHLESVVKDDFCESYFCICGTKSFDKDMINMLNVLKIPNSRFYKF